ncbi:MAG: hypothetical protein K9M80_02050 [Candidatus Marinimicrobia bacterium]|nr:hypothetical protein [Candidatus Neomarinimicrobiota bacterium]
MAHYLITAKPKEDKLRDLKNKLEKGAFIALEPFGETLTHSLKHARIRENGNAVWEEEDYCSPPLKQERAAVLDDYFVHIDVKPVKEGEGWKRISDLSKLFPNLTI